MRRLFHWIGALALTALLPSTALAQNDETTTLEVGYMPILPVAQLFVMEGAGWTDEAGLDLELTRFSSGPAMVQALQDQAAGILHTSNLYRIPHQETLADRLCDLAGMEAVFFCNSGAEANEAAIKLARLHGHRQGIEERHMELVEVALADTPAMIAAGEITDAKTVIGLSLALARLG